MQLKTFGKRQFAFGLNWIVAHDNLVDEVEAAVGPTVDLSQSYVYHAQIKPVRRRKGKAASAVDESVVEAGFSVGFVVSEQRIKATFSAAEAFARSGRDGLFVAELDDTTLWFCGIRAGSVVPSTDQVGTAESIRDRVLALSAGLDLVIFSAGECGIDSAEPFAIEAILAEAKLKPMSRLRRGGNPFLPVLAIVVVGGLCALGYKVLNPPQPTLSPAQVQEQMRANYVASVSGLIKTYPTEKQWVIDAYWQARSQFPPFMEGWALDGVSCTPASCEAMYSVEKDKPFVVSPMARRFGQRFRLLKDGHSATVVLPLQTTIVPVTEHFLRTLPRTGMALMDWVGLVPVSMAGAKVNGQILDSDLGKKFNAAGAGMPPLVMEQVAIKSLSYLDDRQLVDVVVAGTRGHFTPVQMAWSFGEGKVPASWRMTWSRLHD